MTNGIGHRVIAISRIFLNDQWKFLTWWLLSKSEYNGLFCDKDDNSVFVDKKRKLSWLYRYTVK